MDRDGERPQRHIEERPIGGYRNPGGAYIVGEWHNRCGSAGFEGCAAHGKTQQQSGADSKHHQSGETKPCHAKRDPGPNEVHGAVENVRARHQHHTGTDGNQPAGYGQAPCDADAGNHASQG